MDLTGLDLGAWLTKSGAVVLLSEYDEVTHVFIGHVVHPMREVRYGKDGRLVSCCLLPGESQTVEHEQQLHDCLHLDRKLDDDMAVVVVNSMEWNHLVRSREVGATMTRMLVESGEPVAQAPHEDWVEITDPNHVLRPNIDWLNQDGLGWWLKMKTSETIEQVGNDFPLSTFKFRCLRHHHPDFAPARRQDSAGAGIYDEMPPLVNTYADRTLNASRLLQDAVDEAKVVLDTPPAEIEVIPPPLREWRVLTPGGCWETVVADEVCTCNISVDMYRNKRQVGFFVNPQAVIAGSEVDSKPAVPTVTIDLLTPLGDAIGVLRKVAKSNTCSVAVEQAVMACLERFDNLVKTVRGG